MADIFISYSRKDKGFVQQLHAVLASQKRDIWVDWEDIPLTADWMAEIRSGIESLEFSPDGRTLAAGGSDGSVKMWDVSLTAWQERGCRIVNRNLTGTEWRLLVGAEVTYRATCPAAQ